MIGAMRRREFLGGGAVALGAGGAVLALSGCGGGSGPVGISAPSSDPLGDAEIGRVLAGAELLAIDFYRRAAEVGGLDAEHARYLRAAGADERDHYLALLGEVGADAPRELSFGYPVGTFASAETLARTGTQLEAVFLGGCLGAVAELRDEGLRTLCARIAASEAQHLTVLGDFLAPDPRPVPSLPSVLTVREAARAVAAFLA